MSRTIFVFNSLLHPFCQNPKVLKNFSLHCKNPHKNKYYKEIGIITINEAYIESIILKKHSNAYPLKEDDCPRMVSEKPAKKIESFEVI